MLATIRELGFTDIETASFYGRSPGEFRKLLDANGLLCSSIITNPKRLDGEFEVVASEAKIVGAKWVLTAGITRKGQFTPEDAHKAAADFNRWGEKLKAEGLQFGYHPHGFEFVPTEGGGNLFDVLLKETKPELVTFELDVFWFARGGADPLKYLRSHPKRFSLMHLKDIAKGTPSDHTGKAPDETSVPLGEGAMDWPAILKAARAAGIQHYYIEDEHPAAARQVPKTLGYLKKIGF